MSSSSSSSSSSSQASLQQIRDAVRDITVWKRKKLSATVVLVATAAWVMLEIYQFKFVTLVSWVALVLVASLFLWANLLRVFGKDPPSLSGLEVSEKSSTEAANSARLVMEEGVRWMFRIAAQEQVFSSVGAVLGLWFLSYIGSQFDFPTLLYIGTLMGTVVPPLYLRYGENLRRYGERVRAQARRLYDLIDEKVIRMAQSKLAKETKEKKLE